MAKRIPSETIQAFARTIHQEALKYGFGQLDIIRLVNALMDVFAGHDPSLARPQAEEAPPRFEATVQRVDDFPLHSSRVRIRAAVPASDSLLLQRWLKDDYGRHFLLSCATAQHLDVVALLGGEQNKVGIIELHDGTPIGAMAFLDIDLAQRRAELRKLIGERSARGKGYAEEATALWVKYGIETLGIEKIFVSTLQTHLRNIKLNEVVGFRVEGVLRGEVLLGDERHDVLRMGLCATSRR